jgi:hypothetical protein
LAEEVAKALFLKSKREVEMKTAAVVVVLASFCAGTGVLADDSCKVQAEGKNLHGAALTSFTKKCCNDQAAAQKNFTGQRRRASQEMLVRCYCHVKVGDRRDGARITPDEMSNVKNLLSDLYIIG